MLPIRTRKAVTEKTITAMKKSMRGTHVKMMATPARKKTVTTDNVFILRATTAVTVMMEMPAP
jgi:hypothetical protein